MESLRNFLLRYFLLIVILWMSSIGVFTYMSINDVKKIYMKDFQTTTSLTAKNIHYILDLYYSKPVVEFNLQNIKFRFENVEAAYLLFNGEESIYPKDKKFTEFFKYCKNVKKESTFRFDNYILVCSPIYEQLASELIVERERKGVLGILFRKQYLSALIRRWITKNLTLFGIVIIISIATFLWIIRQIGKNFTRLEDIIETTEKILNSSRPESKIREKQKLKEIAEHLKFEEFKKLEKLIERLIERVTNLTKELRKQAIVDSLTGLYNRNYYENFTEGIVNLAQRQGSPFAAAIIDIDDFKQVNDIFGHQRGDEVLKILGRLIKKGIRKSDIPIRYGGEEILILFPNTDRKRAAYVLDRIRKKFSEVDFGIGKPITFSGGVAGVPEDIKELTSLEELVEKADEKLYLAKRSGKDKIVV